MNQRYATGSIVLHWAMAVAIVGLFVLGWYMVDIPAGTPARGYYFNLHKSFGLIAMALIAVFVGFRLRRAAPPHPDSMRPWEKSAAHLAHVLTYILLVVVPVSGYVEANFTKYGIKFFGYPLKPWGPDLVHVSDVLSTVHVYCANAFAVLVGIHAGAAIKHWLIDRDNVLQRMLPFD